MGIRELGPAQEAQVTRPGPDRLRVSKAQSGVKVIRLQDLLAIAAVVTAAVVSAVDPDLEEETRTNEGFFLELAHLKSHPPISDGLVFVDWG